jgi:hypothetical protein
MGSNRIALSGAKCSLQSLLFEAGRDMSCDSTSAHLRALGLVRPRILAQKDRIERRCRGRRLWLHDLAASAAVKCRSEAPPRPGRTGGVPASSPFPLFLALDPGCHAAYEGPAQEGSQ